MRSFFNKIIRSASSNSETRASGSQGSSASSESLAETRAEVPSRNGEGNSGGALRVESPSLQEQATVARVASLTSNGSESPKSPLSRGAGALWRNLSRSTNSSTGKKRGNIMRRYNSLRRSPSSLLSSSSGVDQKAGGSDTDAVSKLEAHELEMNASLAEDVLPGFLVDALGGGNRGLGDNDIRRIAALLAGHIRLGETEGGSMVVKIESIQDPKSGLCFETMDILEHVVCAVEDGPDSCASSGLPASLVACIGLYYGIRLEVVTEQDESGSMNSSVISHSVDLLDELLPDDEILVEEELTASEGEEDGQDTSSFKRARRKKKAVQGDDAADGPAKRVRRSRLIFDRVAATLCRLVGHETVMFSLIRDPDCGLDMLFALIEETRGSEPHILGVMEAMTRSSIPDAMLEYICRKGLLSSLVASLFKNLNSANEQYIVVVVDLIVALLLASCRTSQVLLDEFRACGGYRMLFDALLALPMQAEPLLISVRQLIYLGPGYAAAEEQGSGLGVIQSIYLARNDSAFAVVCALLCRLQYTISAEGCERQVDNTITMYHNYAWEFILPLEGATVENGTLERDSLPKKVLKLLRLPLLHCVLTVYSSNPVNFGRLDERFGVMTSLLASLGASLSFHDEFLYMIIKLLELIAMGMDYRPKELLETMCHVTLPTLMRKSARRKGSSVITREDAALSYELSLSEGETDDGANDSSKIRANSEASSGRTRQGSGRNEAETGLGAREFVLEALCKTLTKMVRSDDRYKDTLREAGLLECVIFPFFQQCAGRCAMLTLPEEKARENGSDKNVSAVSLSADLEERYDSLDDQLRRDPVTSGMLQMLPVWCTLLCGMLDSCLANQEALREAEIHRALYSLIHLSPRAILGVILRLSVRDSVFLQDDVSTLLGLIADQRNDRALAISVLDTLVLMMKYNDSVKDLLRRLEGFEILTAALVSLEGALGDASVDHDPEECVMLVERIFQAFTVAMAGNNTVNRVYIRNEVHYEALSSACQKIGIFGSVQDVRFVDMVLGMATESVFEEGRRYLLKTYSSSGKAFEAGTKMEAGAAIASPPPNSPPLSALSSASSASSFEAEMRQYQQSITSAAVAAQQAAAKEEGTRLRIYNVDPLQILTIRISMLSEDGVGRLLTRLSELVYEDAPNCEILCQTLIPKLLFEELFEKVIVQANPKLHEPGILLMGSLARHHSTTRSVSQIFGKFFQLNRDETNSMACKALLRLLNIASNSGQNDAFMCPYVQMAGPSDVFVVPKKEDPHLAEQGPDSASHSRDFDVRKVYAPTSQRSFVQNNSPGNIHIAGLGKRSWPPTSGFTLSLWVWLGESDSSEEILLASVRSSDGQQLLRVTLESDNSIRCATCGVNVGANAAATGGSPNGQNWLHGAASSNGQGPGQEIKQMSMVAVAAVMSAAEASASLRRLMQGVSKAGPKTANVASTNGIRSRLIRNLAPYQTEFSSLPILAGRWHHVMLVHKLQTNIGMLLDKAQNGRITLFLDGVEIGTQKLPYPTPSLNGGLKTSVFVGVDPIVTATRRPTDPVRFWRLGPMQLLAIPKDIAVAQSLWILGVNYIGSLTRSSATFRDTRAFTSVLLERLFSFAHDHDENCADDSSEQDSPLGAAIEQQLKNRASPPPPQRRRWSSGAPPAVEAPPPAIVKLTVVDLLHRLGHPQANWKSLLHANSLFLQKKGEVDPSSVVFAFNAGRRSTLEGFESIDTKSLIKKNIMEIDVPRTVLHNSAATGGNGTSGGSYPANVGQQPIVAVLGGGAFAVTPLPLCDTIRGVGGVTVILRVLEMAQEPEQVVMVLQLLRNVLSSHEYNRFTFRQSNGHRTLAWLLFSIVQKTRESVTSQVFESMLNFAVLGSGRLALVVDPEMLHQLILNHQVWRGAEKSNTQRWRFVVIILQWLSNLVDKSNLNVDLNLDALHRLNIIDWVLEIMLSLAIDVPEDPGVVSDVLAAALNFLHDLNRQKVDQRSLFELFKHVLISLPVQVSVNEKGGGEEAEAKFDFDESIDDDEGNDYSQLSPSQGDESPHHSKRETGSQGKRSISLDELNISANLSNLTSGSANSARMSKEGNNAEAPMPPVISLKNMPSLGISKSAQSSPYGRPPRRPSRRRTITDMMMSTTRRSQGARGMQLMLSEDVLSAKGEAILAKVRAVLFELLLELPDRPREGANPARHRGTIFALYSDILSVHWFSCVLNPELDRLTFLLAVRLLVGTLQESQEFAQHFINSGGFAMLTAATEFHPELPGILFSLVILWCGIPVRILGSVAGKSGDASSVSNAGRVNSDGPAASPISRARVGGLSPISRSKRPEGRYAPSEDSASSSISSFVSPRVKKQLLHRRSTLETESSTQSDSSGDGLLAQFTHVAGQVSALYPPTWHLDVYGCIAMLLKPLVRMEQIDLENPWSQRKGLELCINMSRLFAATIEMFPDFNRVFTGARALEISSDLIFEEAKATQHDMAIISSESTESGDVRDQDGSVFTGSVAQAFLHFYVELLLDAVAEGDGRRGPDESGAAAAKRGSSEGGPKFEATLLRSAVSLGPPRDPRTILDHMVQSFPKSAHPGHALWFQTALVQALLPSLSLMLDEKTWAARESSSNQMKLPHNADPSKLVSMVCYIVGRASFGWVPSTEHTVLELTVQAYECTGSQYKERILRCIRGLVLWSLHTSISNETVAETVQFSRAVLRNFATLRIDVFVSSIVPSPKSSPIEGYREPYLAPALIPMPLRNFFNLYDESAIFACCLVHLLLSHRKVDCDDSEVRRSTKELLQAVLKCKRELLAHDPALEDMIVRLEKGGDPEDAEDLKSTQAWLSKLWLTVQKVQLFGSPEQCGISSSADDGASFHGKRAVLYAEVEHAKTLRKDCLDDVLESQASTARKLTAEAKDVMLSTQKEAVDRHRRWQRVGLEHLLRGKRYWKQEVDSFRAGLYKDYFKEQAPPTTSAELNTIAELRADRWMLDFSEGRDRMRRMLQAQLDFDEIYHLVDWSHDQEGSAGKRRLSRESFPVAEELNLVLNSPWKKHTKGKNRSRTSTEVEGDLTAESTSSLSSSSLFSPETIETGTSAALQDDSGKSEPNQGGRAMSSEEEGDLDISKDFNLEVVAEVASGAGQSDDGFDDNRKAGQVQADQSESDSEDEDEDEKESPEMGDALPSSSKGVASAARRIGSFLLSRTNSLGGSESSERSPGAQALPNAEEEQEGEKGSILDSQFEQRGPHNLRNENGSFSLEDEMVALGWENAERLVTELDHGDRKPERILNCSRLCGLEATPGIFLICEGSMYFASNYEVNSNGAIDELPEHEAQQQHSYEVCRTNDGYLHIVSSTFGSGSKPSTPNHRAFGPQPTTPMSTTSLCGASVATGDKRSLLGQSGVSHTFVKLSYDNVYEVYRRRYMFDEVGIEFFAVDGQNFLLVFANSGERDWTFTKVLSHEMPNLVVSKTSEMASLANSLSLSAETLSTSSVGMGSLAALMAPWRKFGASMTRKWRDGEITNFGYLMYLNTLAGRSHNDLTQYPVFPWILRDYSSATLDLENPASYRDLSKPMGALNEVRAKQFTERYASLASVADESGVKPFHYGTHYSCSAYVLQYMIRLEPYTRMALDLQGGHFDRPDRLFISFATSWRSVSGEDFNAQDVRELIPEFFYLPEILLNKNRFDFGTTQRGTRVDDVELPDWARGDPYRFVRIHRRALESRYVSEHLHEWIDLIFGYKQRGRAAIQAQNVFHPLTYEGEVNPDEIEDPLMRQATRSQIHNFGQTPRKLFSKPHPKRVVPPTRGSESLAPSDPGMVWHAKLAPPLVVPGAFCRPSSIMRPGQQSSPATALPGQVCLVPVEAIQVRLLSNDISGGGGSGGSSTVTGMGLAIREMRFTTSNDRIDAVSGSAMLLCSGAAPPSSLSGRDITTSNKAAAAGLKHYINYEAADGSLHLHVAGTPGGLGGLANATAPKLVAIFEHLHVGPITACKARGDGHEVWTGGMDALVCVWRLRKLKANAWALDQVACLASHSSRVTCLATSQAHRIAVSGSKDCTVVLWDLDKRRYVRHIGCPKTLGAPIQEVSINNSNGYVLVLSGQEMLAYYHINGHLLASLHMSNLATNHANLGRAHCALATMCDDFQDGIVAVTGHEDGRIALWDLPLDENSKDSAEANSTLSLEQPSTVQRENSASSRSSLGSSKSDRGSSEHFVLRAILETGRAAVPVTSLALDANGRRLAAGDLRGNIKVWQSVESCSMSNAKASDFFKAR